MTLVVLLLLCARIGRILGGKLISVVCKKSSCHNRSTVGVNLQPEQGVNFTNFCLLLLCDLMQNWSCLVYSYWNRLYQEFI